MTMRIEKRYVTVCDGCHKEHSDRHSRNAMEARIKSGVDGFTFVANGGGRSADKRSFDFCAECISDADATIARILAAGGGS